MFNKHNHGWDSIVAELNAANGVAPKQAKTDTAPGIIAGIARPNQAQIDQSWSAVVAELNKKNGVADWPVTQGRSAAMARIISAPEPITG